MEPFNSRRAATHASHGMVASSQPLAAQVGLQVLKDGGNAADAAIAVAAMVNVTEPMMNGLGGDSFILVHWQRKLHGLNASGRCPQGINRHSFVDAGWKHMPQAGWGSVCVPGAPDGYFALHESFGQKSSPISSSRRPLMRRKDLRSGKKYHMRGNGAHPNCVCPIGLLRNISYEASRQSQVKFFGNVIWRGLGARSASMAGTIFTRATWPGKSSRPVIFRSQ